MRILKLCLAVSMLAAGLRAEACGPWYYSPSDYNLYRLLPYDFHPQRQGGFVERNCRRWCRTAGLPQRDMEEVHRAIYDATLREWEWAATESDVVVPSVFAENRFVERLMKRRDKEALTLLWWSKEYESIRNQQRSPWYYNSRISVNHTQLLALYDKARSHKGSRYADRYAFLAIKCAWALSKDSEVVELWNKNRKRLENGILREEAEDYVARSLRRLGCDAEANAIYRRSGSGHQVVEPGTPLPEALRTLLRVDPSSPYLAYWLQQMFFALENNPYQLSDRTLTDYCDHEAVLDVAREAIADPRVGQKALWRYVAAGILDFEGRTIEALQMLDSIDTHDDFGPAPQFLCNSIRVLRFSLHCRLDSVDDRFEAYALGELRWMDNQLLREWRQLPERERNEVSHASCPHDVRRHCYMHDAMNRIVLEDSVGLAFRLAMAGRKVRALQMANLADNRLIGISSNRVIGRLRSSADRIYRCWYRTSEGNFEDTCLLRVADTVHLDGSDFKWIPYRFNEHDYSNTLFLMADRMDAATLDGYCQRILCPHDGNDSWLNARGYTDGDYWQDVVGTHYLRERNYAAAARHLKLVSPGYQRRMNIRCTIDPFCIDYSVASFDSTRYKLNYALRMAGLQQTLQSEFDPDRRGLAMLEYAIGLENSFGRCWYLTSYGWSCYSDYSDEWGEMNYSPVRALDITNSPYAREARSVAQFLRSVALRTLQSDEARARYYARLGQVATVMKRYPTSSAACHYALVCDEWRDHLHAAPDTANPKTVQLASLDFRRI